MKIANNRKIAGIALALSTIFGANAVFAQDNMFDFGETTTQEMDKKIRLRALLPKMTDSPFAGAEVRIPICAQDGLNDACEYIHTTIPLPALLNPIGYEVQTLRRNLALAIANTNQDADGNLELDDLRMRVMEVVNSFGEFLDENSTQFQNIDTLIIMMDHHHDLTLQTGKATNLAALTSMIQNFADVMQQLEDDLLSPAAKAFKEAEQKLKEALESGEATEEELSELTKQLSETLDAYIKEQENEEDGLSQAELDALQELQDLMKALEDALEELNMTMQDYADLLMQMMENARPKDSPPGPPQEQEDKLPPSYEEMLKQFKKEIEQMKKLVQFIKQIAELIDKQQILRDETLRTEQTGVLPPPDDKTFLERQNELRNSLNNIIGRMKKEKLDSRALERALKEMNEARDDLTTDRYGDAVIDMDEALDLLKQGKENSNNQMALAMPGPPGNQSGQGGNSEDKPKKSLERSDAFIDQDGKLLDSDILNENLGIKTQDPDTDIKEDRRRILERQRSNPDNKFLQRLLEPN